MSDSLTTRRDFLKTAAAGIAASAAADARAQPQSVPSATQPAPPPFCYVDGYHGGIDGHMPPDSLRNVLDGLDRFPKWKVSFEIEPYSWAAFAKSDPPSIDRLRHLLADATPAARVELVSGAYGQTYAWNINGESNVRHLLYGLEEIAAVFPGVRVDTYAVQEPCWTSCLPQLLKSFGYRRAVLTNSTCWGGYHAPTIDADLVNWVGPDGTAIVAVPRYAGDRLVPPATEENARPPAAYVGRCLTAGVRHPAGTTLQDMGWPGRPWRLGMTEEVARSLRNVTWREYVETIAAPASTDWRASQEDVRVGLVWGAPVLQRIAQVVRAAENLILQAEKIASMAKARRGFAYPADDLRRAWADLLKSQHHDVWIVPYNRRSGGGTWASQADERCVAVARTCERIVRDAAAAMAPAPPQADESARQSVRVFNTTGFRRRDVASVDITAVPDAAGFKVTDAEGHSIISQVVQHGDGPARTVLLFPADVPAMGYTTYAVEPTRTLPAQGAPASAHTKADGTVMLETDLYTLAIDPARGGRIVSLFARELGREFVDRTGPRGFNEFRGFFPVQDKWLSSADAPARVEVTENGPVRVAARVSGRLGEYPFVADIRMATGRRRIDLRAAFDFPTEGSPFARGRGPLAFRVGEPWEAGREVTRSNRRPFYDGSFKLQALFPAALGEKPVLYKNAAFDVCRGTSADTRFNAWDAIQHNVIVNWVDLAAADGSAGLALMSDHTTAYAHGPDDPLGLVLCYAGPGNWADYGLGRAPSASYALVPHAGDWARGQLWRELAAWSEPLVGAATSAPEPGDAEWSLLDASDGGVEVTTVFEHGGAALVRLFNAEGDAGEKEIVLAPHVGKVELVELDGKVVAELPIRPRGAGQRAVAVSMPRYGVRTLRLHGDR